MSPTSSTISIESIGRIPLLSHEQEITLGRQVQDLMVLENIESQLQSDLGEKPEIAFIFFCWTMLFLFGSKLIFLAAVTNL